VGAACEFVSIFDGLEGCVDGVLAAGYEGDEFHG